VRLFSGATALQEEFDAALLRLHPVRAARLVHAGMLVPTAVSASDARRARDYFEDTIGRTLRLDLSDLSADRWSLVPPPDDLIAEVRTRRFGILTYARVQSQLEDVTLFDRRGGRNISMYASPEKLASRGRFYSEEEASEYDVESIELDADVDPLRPWIEGRAALTLVTRMPLLSLTLKLAEPLVVRSVESNELGRLTLLRVTGQESIVVRLPATVAAHQRLTVRVAYGGRLPPPPPPPGRPPPVPPGPGRGAVGVRRGRAAPRGLRHGGCGSGADPR
jgi:hypothetical protein